MPKNKLIDKLKNDRGARAMAVTVAVMMLVLVAIIVVTVVANRTVQQEPLPRIDTTPAAVTDLTDDETDLATVTPPQSEQPEETNALPAHFLLPVHGVLQKEHSADVQVFSTTMNDYRVHLGIDIGTVAGATVSAMADGTVIEIWDSVGLGHCVAVQHSGDACTIYKNLAPEDPAGIVVGAAVDILWLAFLGGTGIYEIVPGFLCGLLAAFLVSVNDSRDRTDVEELFDRCEAYKG